ncbi:serine/threonine-protein kinase [Kamptonema animale CS-326]|jgi:serine/threonine protein kinase|uniref:serine/threonine-protein kinase n=1 Tax=Kamptonema animale TaxID=92934 RepID=UPI00233148E4|nr:serine/threonine-protein kinase [Kamptonema animale]MDB9512352.1 serine/threonine-protein kinase [Kamptonema animale CS-326]
MQHWAPGQQLHEGKYLIEAILGGGDFGVTYRAQNRKEGKLVAIKTLNAIQQGKTDFVNCQGKFMNEALCLAKCSHPHVVEVYEVFPEGDLWCMVMELIDGIDLAEYLEDNGVLSEVQALPIIQQVGNALRFIHQQGFTHQDVKPQNIMLRKQGLEAVLIDFGLARQATVPVKFRANSNFSTECFAPMELLGEGADFGAYTDVYSLAATLYVMLTGELPFPSQCMTMYVRLRGELPFASHFIRKGNIPLTPPKQHNNKISDRVNAAIIRGMNWEPYNRPQSVQEWLDLVMPKQATNEVQLISAVGMDYINLRNLLAAGNWKQADRETASVMLKVAGREEEGWLDSSSIDNFPCEDLRTIDQLWVKYSNGRFGFSVQKRIYQSLGGTREDDSKIWEAWGDRVGWRVNSNWLEYEEVALGTEFHKYQGHLPAAKWVMGRLVLFSRFETCKL